MKSSHASDHLHRLFRQGARHFNRGEYFAAHEVWEEAWKTCDIERVACKRQLHSLIQAAACLYHWYKGNLAGAQSLCRKGQSKLADWPDHTSPYQGLVELWGQIDRLLQQADPNTTPAPDIRFTYSELSEQNHHDGAINE